jgi:hypothetical protein
MIRNFVAKNNFNRSAVHKSAKDYSRQKLNARDYDLYEDMEPPLAF